MYVGLCENLFEVIYTMLHSSITMQKKTLVYLLKTKDEVFTKFQEFKTEVENITKESTDS